MVQQNPPHEQSIHECISIVHYSSMHAFDSTCIVYTLGVYYLCGWSCCWWKKKTRFSVTTLTSDYHAIDDCTSIVLYKLLFFGACPQWFIHSFIWYMLYMLSIYVHCYDAILYYMGIIMGTIDMWTIDMGTISNIDHSIQRFAKCTTLRPCHSTYCYYWH